MISRLLDTIRPLLTQLWLVCLLCMAGLAHSQQGEGPVLPTATNHNTSLPGTTVPPEIDVQVTARIEPGDGLVVSQQVILYIEVATPNWFSGGTRISSFEMDDVVVLRREKFSLNSIRRVGDQTWSVQLWSITLYPQTAGRFVIPEIELDISSAKEGGQVTTVSRRTKSISFVVGLPDEIQQQMASLSPKMSTWVATTRFQVEEGYDRKLTELKVGDSVKRTIEIRSENIAAMMLPALDFVAPDGLAPYQDPPKITDRVNRGDYIASRLETVVYVIEKAGSYRLPQLDFYWWDLNTQSLRLVTLPEQVISTRGFSSAGVSEFDQSDKSLALDTNFDLRNPWFIFLLGIALMLVVLWRMKSATSDPVELNHQESLADLEQKFRDQCRQKNFSQASSSFYQWFSSQAEVSGLAISNFSVRCWLRTTNRPAVLKLFDDFMAAAHGSVSYIQAGGQSDESQLFESLLTEMKPLLLDAERSCEPETIVDFRLN